MVPVPLEGPFLRTYYPAVPNIWEGITVPTGHLWSLNIEEHSYIFMSLLTLIAFKRKREGIALICAGIAAILTTRYYARHLDIAPYLFEIRTECAASFIMISAGYSLIRNKVARFVTPAMPVISLIAAFCCYSQSLPYYWQAKVFLAPFLLSFTANHLSEAWGTMIKMLCFRPLRLLGLYSYSIYLWQQPFFVNKDSMYPGVALLLAVAVGIASFYLFENPTRRWINERRYLTLSSKWRSTRPVQAE